jgi:UDP-N-acetylglucosamine acyltransferase
MESSAQTRRETQIHPTAIVSPKAELDVGVEIGPFSIISEDVRIGRGTVIGPHVQIDRWTVLGEDNKIFFGCTLGNPSKDLKYKGGRSWARIGDRNVLREYVSISRSSFEDGATVVGNDNLLMNWVSLAHDAKVGNHVIMANLATLGGHVIIEDDARIGAMAGFHPFVRVGRMAMAGGASKFVKDVPPFCVADGHPARLRGLNVVGIKTSSINPLSKLAPETLKRLKKAYRILFIAKASLEEAIARVRREVEPDPQVEYLLRFIETSQRGIAV